MTQFYKDKEKVSRETSRKPQDTSLYIHWPFCLSKCPYCDFNSHVREKVDQKRWKVALLQELEISAGQSDSHSLVSIFFGGGTPSLMDPETVGSLIEKARYLFTTDMNLEVTLEANPGTVESERFKGFQEAGVNRLSIGIQSLNDDTLTFLGRRHSAREALKALEIAAKFFPRYSFDLIYARPDQTYESWKEELARALTYASGHLSLYQLTIEPQTAFATRLRRGEKMTLEDDPAAALYELTEEMMSTAGIPAYEVSNYASLGQECLHNLIYWNFGQYIGIGPGAHGRVIQSGQKHATSRFKAPETWLAAVETHGHGLQVSELLSAQERLHEFTLMGLRLTKGLDLNRLMEETGLRVDQAYSPQALSVLEKEGLILRTSSHLIATLEGRLRLNGVIGFLLNPRIQH